MNDTTIYIGTYIKAKIPKTQVLSNKKACPVCTYKSNMHEFCPDHGKEMVQFYEVGLAHHPYDILYNLFDGDEDRFRAQFFGHYEDGYVCFMPNHGDQGGRYLRSDEDRELEIPAYNLDGDWQRLTTYLLESKFEYEVKYGILVVGEK